MFEPIKWHIELKLKSDYNGIRIVNQTEPCSAPVAHQHCSDSRNEESTLAYIYIYIYIYLKKLTIEANLYSTINKVKVAGFFIPKTHMAFRLILFSELTSGK